MEAGEKKIRVGGMRKNKSWKHEKKIRVGSRREKVDGFCDTLYLGEQNIEPYMS